MYSRARSTPLKSPNRSRLRDAPRRRSPSRGGGHCRILGLTAEPTIATRRLLGFSRKASPWDSQQPIRRGGIVQRGAARDDAEDSCGRAVRCHSRPTRGLPLAARLADNFTVVLSAYGSIVKAIVDGRQITPAGEWLIDNFHLVETRISQISTDLPPGYYRQLPNSSPVHSRAIPAPSVWRRRLSRTPTAALTPKSWFPTSGRISRFNPSPRGALAVSITLQIVLIEV